MCQILIKILNNKQFQTQVYITLRLIHQKGAEKLVKDVDELSYLANTAIINIRIFSRRYHFRL